MRFTATLMLAILLTLSATNMAVGEGFQDQLIKLAEDNAKGYIGPFSTAFGTNMNSGLYHSAKTHKFLGFDISVKAAIANVADDDLVYNYIVGDELVIPAPNLGLPNNELTLNPSNIYPDRETPTVFGDDEGRNLEPIGAEQEIVDALLAAGKTSAEIDLLRQSGELASLVGSVLPLPTVPGINFTTVPLVLPQVSVGLPMKTEVMLRFIPEIKISEEIGKLNFLGIGVKHNLSQYIPIPLFPVDITGQFVWQKFEVGDILESSHTAYNIHASKKFGLGLSLTPYVGIGLESSSLSVDYTVEIDDPNDPNYNEQVTFELEGDNKFRMTGGLRIGLPLTTINVDYSIGEYSVMSAGVGLTLR